MAEITDRPTRFKGAGYEADVWVESGRKVGGHSEEGRHAVESAGVVVLGLGVDQIGRASPIRALKHRLRRYGGGA